MARCSPASNNPYRLPTRHGRPFRQPRLGSDADPGPRAGQRGSVRRRRDVARASRPDRHQTRVSRPRGDRLVALRRGGQQSASPTAPLSRRFALLGTVLLSRYEPGYNEFPIVASRGCARTCSFCSIHTFYRTAPGKVVRLRSAELVADEMLHLHRERGATIFLFQDDAFPIFGPVWRKWTYRFLDALHERDLPIRIRWKIK